MAAAASSDGAGSGRKPRISKKKEAAVLSNAASECRTADLQEQIDEMTKAFSKDPELLAQCRGVHPHR